jgi:PiT family inorganic phosphate transporter
VNTPTATLVAVGVFTGYPIATAFTVTGAVVGAGLALGRGAAWAKYQEIGLLWVLVPFVGGGVAYGTARMLRELDADRYTVPALAALVGVLVANIGFVFLGPANESVSMAGAVAAGTGAPLLVRAGATLALALAVALALGYDMAGDEASGQQHFLLALGALVAFSAGGTQVGLAVGPLIPLIETGGSGVPVALLALGGAGLLVGSWTGAPRMIKALSQDYSSLGPRRSIAALIPSFAIAQTAVFFGIPVSFNEIIVSAIVGSGYAAGTSAVSREKMAKTVAAWVGSLVLALAVSYAIFAAFDAVV